MAWRDVMWRRPRPVCNMTSLVVRHRLSRIPPTHAHCSLSSTRALSRNAALYTYLVPSRRTVPAPLESFEFHVCRQTRVLFRQWSHLAVDGCDYGRLPAGVRRGWSLSPTRRVNSVQLARRPSSSSPSSRHQRPRSLFLQLVSSRWHRVSCKLNPVYLNRCRLALQHLLLLSHFTPERPSCTLFLPWPRCSVVDRSYVIYLSFSSRRHGDMIHFLLRRLPPLPERQFCSGSETYWTSEREKTTTTTTRPTTMSRKTSRQTNVSKSTW